MTNNTSKLIQLSKSLSYKIQDPIENGLNNGKRASADTRLSYLNRAYRRLMRYVQEVYPDVLDDIFPTRYETETRVTDDKGKLFLDNFDTAEKPDVFVKKERLINNWKKVNYVESSNWGNVISGVNKLFAPSIQRLFFRIAGKGIQIEPQNEYKIIINYRKTIPQFQYNEIDIDIPEQFFDLLLSLAAAEYYLDMGNADMATAQKSDAYDQLKMIQGVSK